MSEDSPIEPMRPGLRVLCQEREPNGRRICSDFAVFGSLFQLRSARGISLPRPRSRPRRCANLDPTHDTVLMETFSGLER